MNALARIKFWFIPLVGGGIAYTTVVHLSGSLRKDKDPRWNHFLGGAAIGTVVGKHCTIHFNNHNH